MIGRTFNKLYGSSVIARNLRGQRRIPFMPREKIDAMRDERIRSIVTYAAKHVPYYRDLFTKLRMDPKQIQCAADMEKLPLLDKQQPISHPERFLAETKHGRSALTFLTSGSTGRPMRVSHDQHSLLLNIPFGEREREPFIRACGTFRPREIYVGNETSVIKQVMAFYRENTMLPVRPRRRFVSVLEPLENVAELINKEKPDLLVGYGGWIHLFFKTIWAKKIDLWRPKMVIYMAEALPHGGRDHIEGNFGIPVMSRYSAAEVFKIGFYCEKRTGFHLHEDLCHTRIVGPDGKTLPPGQVGELVVSNLINRGSVFLNYRIGDMGAMSDQKCPCGRTFTLLSELEGRVEDLLPLADGRVVHPRAIWEVFKHYPQVLQYQLTQHETTRFEVKLTTADDEGFRQALEQAMPRLQRVLGPESKIDASRQTDFNRDGRKFRAVSSFCKSK